MQIVEKATLNGHWSGFFIKQYGCRHQLTNILKRTVKGLRTT